MTRQEAIQTLSKVGKISVSYAEDLYDSFFPKPVVPQYVADWYEEHKYNLNSEIYYLIRYWEMKKEIQISINGLMIQKTKQSKPSSTCTSSGMRSRKSLGIRFGLKGLVDTVNTSIEMQTLKDGFLHRKQNLKDFEHTTPAKS